MKKLILSLAITAMTLTGFTAAAATDKKDAKTNTDCPADTRCARHDGPRRAFCAFEGLNLTDAQKEQLKALHQRETKGDSAKVKEKMAAKEQKREARRQARRARLAQIKAILTPEQYVTYLENMVLDGHKSGKATRKGGKKGGKMMRPGQHQGMHQGQRPDGPRAPRGQRPGQEPQAE